MRSLHYCITRYFLLLLLALPAMTRMSPAQGIPPLGEGQGGMTYILPFPDTTENMIDPGYRSTLQDKFQLFVYSPVKDNTIRFGWAGLFPTYKALKEGSFEVIDVKPNPVVSYTGYPHSNTFVLKADQPVVVYCYFVSKFGAEGWTPIPVEAWGKEYHAAARPGEIISDVRPGTQLKYRKTNKGAPAEILVIAAFDDTHITINPTGRLDNFPQTVNVRLNAFEAYQVQSYVDTLTSRINPPQVDLGGTQITSDKPIGVISGNTRAQVVPHDDNGVSGNSFKNALLEWMAPVEQHGTRFVYMPTWDDLWPSRSPKEKSEDLRQAEHIRIYGTSPGVTTGRSLSDATSPFTISPGTFHEKSVKVPDARYFITDKPAQAMMNSSAVVRLNPEQELQLFRLRFNEARAASYMVEMIPREQWVNFAPFIAPAHPANMNHFINVVTDTASAHRIMIKSGDADTGREEAFSFNRGTIPGTDLTWGTMQLARGTSYYLRGLDANVRFQGFVYGNLPGYELVRLRENSSEYEEGLALGYGYPLAPNRCFLSKGDASLSIDTTWSCSDLTITARSVGQTQVGLRSISFEGASTNVQLFPVDPPKGFIPGALTATVRVARTDRSRNAEGVVKIVDRAGRVSRVPYSFATEQSSLTPKEPVDFGEVIVNRPPAERTVTLCNPTGRPMKITEIGTAKASGHFTVKGPSLPLTLNPGECARIDIAMTPAIDSKIHHDSLIITTACAGFGVGLRAETVRPCLTVDDLDFGTIDLNDPSSVNGRNRSLRITNAGNGHITFADSGSGVISWLLKNFTVKEQYLTMLRSASLGPGQWISINVKFVPTEPGIFRTVSRLYANTRECRDTSVWNATVIRSIPTAVPTTGAAGYEISAVVPNPFTSATDIEFSLGAKGNVTIEIFDETGRRAATLLEGVLEAGSHRVRWDAEGYPPGVYYCRVTSGGWSGSTTLTLVR